MSACVKGSSASPRYENVLERGVLTGKQRRHLRALAHSLKPIVQIGKDGISDGVIAAVDRALEDHELVKVKVSEESMERETAAREVAAQTGSEIAQVLGNVLLLYRARKDKPAITLP